MCIIKSEKQALEAFNCETGCMQASLGRIYFDIGSIIAWIGIGCKREAQYISFGGRQKITPLGYPAVPFMAYDEDDENDKGGDIFCYENIFYEVKENRLGQYVEKLKPNILANASQAYRLARANGHGLPKGNLKIAELTPVSFDKDSLYIVWYALMEEGHFIHPMFPRDMVGMNPNAFNWKFLEPGDRFKKDGKHFWVEEGLEGCFIEEKRPSPLRIVR